MVETLTKDIFLEKIFNYEESTEFKYTGKLPLIIDFYADWCSPCKMLAPILEQLSEEYKGKIVIYKVNTELEQELSSVFGIMSLPTLLFCPINEDPQIATGVLPKVKLEQIISNVLKVSK